MVKKLKFDAGDTEGWLKLRESLDDKLGGSEVGAVANHSKYSSFLKKLNERVGLAKPEDISGKMAVKLGHWNEEFVAQEFEARSGKKVHRENCIYLNDEYPHLKATIDRKVSGEDSGLECKFMSDFSMDRFPRGDFPEQYKDQCVTYLAVTNMRRWYLAIVTNTRFFGFLMTRIKAEEERYYDLRRRFLFPDEAVDESDADYIEWKRDWAWLDAAYFLDEDEMRGAEIVAAHFFDCVNKVNEYTSQWVKVNPNIGVPGYADARAAAIANAVYQVVDPSDIDGGETTTDALEELSPIAVADSVVELTPESQDCRELADLLSERARLKSETAERDSRVAEIDNLLALRIKDAETMLLPGWKVTYKAGKPRRSCSAATVEDYFATKGIQVPDGLIKTSDASRSLRVFARKVKAA